MLNAAGMPADFYNVHDDLYVTGRPVRPTEGGTSQQNQPGERAPLRGSGGRPTTHKPTGVRHQGAQNGTTLHQYSQIPAAAVFYPVFYPKRQRGDFEMGYLLVTAANWKDRAERATSLPSWSCGFDPVARSTTRSSSRFGWVHVSRSLGVASVPASPRKRIWQMPGAIAAGVSSCGQAQVMPDGF